MTRHILKKCLSKWVIAAVLGTAAITLLLVLNLRTQVLLVTVEGERSARAILPIAQDEVFSIAFIHSVNQTEVREYYIVKDGQVYLDACTYSGFGAGVATEVTPPAKLQILPDGRMQITGMNMPVPKLSYIVGTVSDHILYIQNQQISLTQLCGKNATVSFTIAKKFIT